MSEQIKKVFADIEKLYIEKQSAYGQVDQKVDECIKQFYPNGVAPSQYEEFCTVIKLLEKISRITNPNITHKAKVDAYRDIAGYAILSVEKDEHVQKGTEVKATEDVVDPSKLFFNDEAIKNFKVLDQKAINQKVINRWQELAGITKKGINDYPDVIEDLKRFHPDITQEDIDNINKYRNETFRSELKNGPLGENDLETKKLVEGSKKLVQDLMNGPLNKEEQAVCMDHD